jgi:hypothetical protein
MAGSSTAPITYSVKASKVDPSDWNAAWGWVTAVTSVTNTYQVLTNDMNIVCNKTTGFTVTLPSATGTGRMLKIKNINTGTVTIARSGSDTIDGETAQYAYQWEGIQLVDYAANNWMVV